MIKSVQIILTFESGLRHAVTISPEEGEGLASTVDTAAFALELYLEDHPNGPAAVAA